MRAGEPTRRNCSSACVCATNSYDGGVDPRYCFPPRYWWSKAPVAARQLGAKARLMFRSGGGALPANGLSFGPSVASVLQFLWRLDAVCDTTGPESFDAGDRRSPGRLGFFEWC